MEKAYLVLGNGRCFEGRRIGAPGERTGELVFTTGMTGYLETLTDPSYAGQIVMQTFPLIGCYGVIPEDFEGRCALEGYVVRELCGEPSNFRSSGALDAFLKEQGICGLCGVDTRELTRVLREEGVMNARICDRVPEDLTPVQAYRVRDAVPRVSRKDEMIYPAAGQAGAGSPARRVTLIDYGAKGNILRCLEKRGCEVREVPYDTSAEAILAGKPDGVMLSNGPGDPKDNPYCVEQIRKLIGRVPLFGICLGHQLAALALGGETVKLKYGHRGANQPVREAEGRRTYITSQNHGYAVVAESLRGVGREIYVNANDGSNEGMAYPGRRCFTVQFHPEACAGPQDMEFLFDRFLSMMEGTNNAQRRFHS